MKGTADDVAEDDAEGDVEGRSHGISDDSPEVNAPPKEKVYTRTAPGEHRKIRRTSCDKSLKACLSIFNRLYATLR